MLCLPCASLCWAGAGHGAVLASCSLMIKLKYTGLFHLHTFDCVCANENTGALALIPAYVFPDHGKLSGNYFCDVDSALRHMVGFLGLPCVHQVLDIDDPRESLTTQNILILFYDCIL